MIKLLNKEFKLSAFPISFIMIAFAVMAFIPQYPIVIGAFFICLGIFQSIQATKENGDIFYSAMLPVRKADVVVSKYAFVIFIQFVGLILTTIFTIVRMMALKDVEVYINNSLMNANLAYLGFFMMVFAVFNTVFVGGFFKTAYKVGMPFVGFAIGAFIVVMISEVLHYIPGLEGLNSTGYEPIQIIPFAVGFISWLVLTMVGMTTSIKKFEKLDL